MPSDDPQSHATPPRCLKAGTFARLLRLLFEEPRSVAELEQLTDLSRQTVRYWLAPLRAKLVHVAAWNARGRPLYSWGPNLPDAAPPSNAKPDLPQPLRPGPNSLALLMELLALGGGTRFDLFECSGIAPRTVRAYLAALRKERLVHVDGWCTDVKGALTVERFSWGPFALDVPHPGALPAAVVTARYRERRRHQKLATQIQAALTSPTVS